MARVMDLVQGHAEPWARLLDLTERQRLPHALIFTGPTGIGKRQVAWGLAQRLVCTAELKPCGECGPCRRVEARQSESVLLVEPTGPSIKIESSQKVLEFLSLARLTAARVIIVDDAQKLNPSAANALLKVVEEPPPSTYFLFITPEISQLLPTLRSRAQVVRFKPLSDEILKQAGENPEWMRRSARGSFARLAEFQGDNDLRALAFDFLTRSVKGERGGLDRFLQATKNRDEAMSALGFLQQGLRDWSALESGALIHDDYRAALEALPTVRVERRVALWRDSFAMEKDMLGHVDRNLIFENFFYRSSHALD